MTEDHPNLVSTILIFLATLRLEYDCVDNFGNVKGLAVVKLKVWLAPRATKLATGRKVRPNFLENIVQQSKHKSWVETKIVSIN